MADGWISCKRVVEEGGDKQEKRVLNYTFAEHVHV